MRSFSSVIALISILFSVCSPVIAQRQDEQHRQDSSATRKGKRPPRPAGHTEFRSIKAESDGKGTIVRWNMDREVENLGFVVYRQSVNGPKAVSELVPGGILTNGSGILLTDASYSHFDPSG